MLEEKLNNILLNIFKITEDELVQDYGMEDVSNWDSLTHMSLIVAIEEDFGIELSGDDIAEMITFNAIRTTVTKYL